MYHYSIWSLSLIVVCPVRIYAAVFIIARECGIGVLSEQSVGIALIYQVGILA